MSLEALEEAARRRNDKALRRHRDKEAAKTIIEAAGIVREKQVVWNAAKEAREEAERVERAAHVEFQTALMAFHGACEPLFEEDA